MKRATSVLASAVVLIALLPGSTSAAMPIKYSDHAVETFCEGPVDGGYALIGMNTSTAFDDAAGADVWLDPAVPFEDPSSMSGFGSEVGRTESPSEIVLTATFPLFDADGNELGDAVAVATMAQTGDPEIIGPIPGKSNHHSRTSGTRQPLEGSVSLSVPGHVFTLSGCFGSVTDVDVFETNPHSFVSSGKGVIVDCFWPVSDDSAAYFFAQKDGPDFFADAGLTTPDIELGGTGQSSGSLSATALAATVELEDRGTGDPHAAVANATFTTIGAPFTSTLISQHGRTRTTEQALAAHGTLTFDTGDSFVMDAEHCRANTFDRHSQSNVSPGPRPAAAPANDAPDGAVRLTKSSKPNLNTGGTVLEAEVPILTCPEGERDAMGHTVWYTIIGTGGPITIDTSASDFDTVAAAYVIEDEGLTEVACVDDVEYAPIGASYQAVLTFDTEAGVEYYVQVGGYSSFFSGDAEWGRLRIAVH